MYVFHPIAPAVCAEDTGAFLLKHSAAIVHHLENDILPFPVTGNGENPFSGSFLVIKTMDDGIFRKRLQKEIQDGEGEDIPGNIIGHIKGIGMHHPLDRNIGLCIFQLGFHSGDAASFVQHGPVEGGKQPCHLADVLLSGHDGLPIDQGQGIIQKVGIDLGLQNFQLIFLLCDFRPQHLVDQVV